MSDGPADYLGRLDLQRIIDDLDRGRAETKKLTQESDSSLRNSAS